jgi:hypothetical protein
VVLIDILIIFIMLTQLCLRKVHIVFVILLDWERVRFYYFIFILNWFFFLFSWLHALLCYASLLLFHIWISVSVMWSSWNILLLWNVQVVLMLDELSHVEYLRIVHEFVIWKLFVLQLLLGFIEMVFVYCTNIWNHLRVPVFLLKLRLVHIVVD